jgi:hypothetical protein
MPRKWGLTSTSFKTGLMLKSDAKKGAKCLALCPLFDCESWGQCLATSPALGSRFEALGGLVEFLELWVFGEIGEDAIAHLHAFNNLGLGADRCPGGHWVEFGIAALV